MMLYISGPITGNPNYLQQFADAELQLSMLGYDVYNPAANVLEQDNATGPGWEGTPSWSDYMRRDILIIARDADGLALLPGWADSEGAVLEVQVAKAFGLPIRTIPGWIQHDEENTLYGDLNIDATGLLEVPGRLRDTPPPGLGTIPERYKLLRSEPDQQDGWDDVDEAKQDPDSPLHLRTEPVAITEAEFLGNDGLGNPAGNPADHTTYTDHQHVPSPPKRGPSAHYEINGDKITTLAEPDKSYNTTDDVEHHHHWKPSPETGQYECHCGDVSINGGQA